PRAHCPSPGRNRPRERRSGCEANASAGPSVVGEAVPHAPDGEDVARTGRVRLDLVAQATDVRVPVVLVALERGAPDGVEQLHPGEGTTRVAREMLQQLELLGGQRDRPLVQPDLPAGRIDLEGAEAKTFGRRLQLRRLHLDPA